MKIARIHTDRVYIFANPENIIEWIILKLRGYKKHYTPIGNCFIKTKTNGGC